MARDGPSKLCEQDILRRPLAILRAERARVRDVRRRRARARGGKRADAPRRGRDDERPRVRFETRAGVRDAVRCATTEADRRRLAWRLSLDRSSGAKKRFFIHRDAVSSVTPSGFNLTPASEMCAMKIVGQFVPIVVRLPSSLNVLSLPSPVSSFSSHSSSSGCDVVAHRPRRLRGFVRV
jgi:hypothetical protein